MEVPVVPPKRPRAYRDVEGELSTFTSDTKVTVKPEGDVIVVRSARKKRPEKDVSVSKD